MAVTQKDGSSAIATAVIIQANNSRPPLLSSNPLLSSRPFFLNTLCRIASPRPSVWNCHSHCWRSRQSCLHHADQVRYPLLMSRLAILHLQEFLHDSPPSHAPCGGINMGSSLTTSPSPHTSSPRSPDASNTVQKAYRNAVWLREVCVDRNPAG